MPTKIFLPFDFVHTLIDFTTVDDLVNFCSTCRALHHHLSNDSLWKRLCSPYGLKDFTYFGGRSPFTIYTKLIHQYGPILGLWASDFPFRGNVLEFRLFPGNESEQGGIVGEVWSCAAHVDRDPIPPSYSRVTKISFESDQGEEAAGQSSDAAQAEASSTVRVFCWSDPAGTPSGIIRHAATLYVRAETHTKHSLEFYRHTVDLPEFPMVQFPWYDPTARQPRLPEQPECQLDQSSIVKIYPAARLPILWTAPSPIRKPPAMSIRCSQNPGECPCAALHLPSITFESLDPRPPRYYPMRRTILPGVDPKSPTWSLQTMEGLWYGSYGVNGTEILYLAFRPGQVDRQLSAIKITGDMATPRGCGSWILSVLEEGSGEAQIARGLWISSLHAGSIRANASTLFPARILRGTGMLVSRGFRDGDVAIIVGGVINADELVIGWPHMFCTYRRYKGRDVRGES